MDKKPRKPCIFLMVVIALLTFASLAPAAELAAPESPVGTALQGVVSGTVIPLVVALVGSLISLVLLKLKSKLNIQLSEETEAWIARQAESAVQMVAEKAAKGIKYGSLHLTSSQKLDMAVASLISKIPRLTREQADGYIHAALARIPGVGATGEQSLVAKT